MASIKQIIQDRFKNYVVVILLMAVIALASIVVLILDCPSWVDVLANSTLGAVIGASLVDLACSVAAGKEADEDMRRGIMETLCPSKSQSGKPELYSIYKKEAIEPILQQCLSAYCADTKLSAGYLSYIRNSCRNVKRNERYVVVVNRDSDGCQYISQSLKHTAIFKPDAGQRPYFQAYFIFRTRSEQADQKGKLDKVMSDKSYFFREHLVDDTFVDELIATYDAAESSGKEAMCSAVLSKLNFSVDIFADETSRTSVRIQNEKYEIDFDRNCGVKIRTYVPEEYIHSSNQFFEEEGFVQYTACMKTGYRIPSTQNTFYVVYAIPTVRPFFEIRFNMGSANFVSNVDYMSFISIDQSVDMADENDGTVREHGVTLSFETQRTVFPRSGIAFTWNS